MSDRRTEVFNSDLADFFLFNQSSAKSECEEAILPMDREPFTLPTKRRNLKQPVDASGKFYKTLPGFLISYIETHGPTKESELVRLLSEHLSTLRNSSGTIYKNSPIKCLHGICKMPVFAIKSDVWDVNHSEVNTYRENFLKKTKSKVVKQHKEKTGMRKTEKIMAVLRNYSGVLAKDPRTERLVKDPLRALKGNENLQEAAQKIGYERLIGILQSYSVVSKHYISLMKQEEGTIEFSNIERDIEGIHSKLSKIESHLLKHSTNSSKSESRAS